MSTVFQDRISLDVWRHLLQHASPQVAKQLAATCRTLYRIVTHDNSLWRRYYRQTYSILARERDWLSAHIDLLQLPDADLPDNLTTEGERFQAKWRNINWQRAFEHRTRTEANWRANRPVSTQRIADPSDLGSLGVEGSIEGVILKQWFNSRTRAAYGLIAVNKQRRAYFMPLADLKSFKPLKVSTSDTAIDGDAIVQLSSEHSVLVGPRYIAIHTSWHPITNFDNREMGYWVYVWNVYDCRLVASIQDPTEVKLIKWQGEWLLGREKGTRYMGFYPTYRYCLYNVDHAGRVWALDVKSSGDVYICAASPTVMILASFEIVDDEQGGLEWAVWRISLRRHQSSAAATLMGRGVIRLNGFQRAIRVSHAKCDQVLMNGCFLPVNHGLIIPDWKNARQFCHMLEFKPPLSIDSDNNDDERLDTSKMQSATTLQIAWEKPNTRFSMAFEEFDRVLLYKNPDYILADSRSGDELLSFTANSLYTKGIGSLCIARIDDRRCIVDVLTGKIVYSLDERFNYKHRAFASYICAIHDLSGIGEFALIENFNSLNDPGLKLDDCSSTSD